MRVCSLLVLLLFATVAFAQSSLPDLIIDGARLQNSIYLKTQTISRTSCAYAEGCVNGTGKRRLLKFDTAIANIGPGDLVLGSPGSHPEWYEWSPCHGHYHLKSGTRYELLTSDLQQVVAGRKNAFCFMDISRYSAGAGSSNGYNCSNQGITAGWQDVYNDTLDCQWIDVTGVAAGQYILRLTVNPDALLVENNYSNNSVQIPITISKGRKTN